MRVALLRQMNVQAKREGLNSLEQAKNIWFQPEGFADKNIMTNTMKLIRFDARKFYKEQIDGMYVEGDILAKK